MNGLKILAADVGNVYLNAQTRDKVHNYIGAEVFGQWHSGIFDIMFRSLYGLSISDTTCQLHFQQDLWDMSSGSIHETQYNL